MRVEVKSEWRAYSLAARGSMPRLLVGQVRVMDKSEWRAYSLASHGGIPHLLIG